MGCSLGELVTLEYDGLPARIGPNGAGAIDRTLSALTSASWPGSVLPTRPPRSARHAWRLGLWTAERRSDDGCSTHYVVCHNGPQLAERLSRIG